MTNVITREQWGAAPPEGRTSLSKGAIDSLFGHYTSMDADRVSSHADCPARVRGIQRYHQETKGWSDIAYNYLTCQHGAVFEGRGWLVMSAATLGQNDHSQAWCFLGADKDGRDDVTTKGRAAMTQVVKHYFKVCGTSIVLPHRAKVSTSCPGDEIAGWIAVKGWLADDPKTKPWPVPIPKWFWAWVPWYRSRWLYPTKAAWMAKRPKSAPKNLGTKEYRWVWVRLAAMS